MPKSDGFLNSPPAAGVGERVARALLARLPELGSMNRGQAA